MSTSKQYEIAFQLGAQINSSMRAAFSNASKYLGDAHQEVENLNESSGFLNKSMGLMSKVVGGAGAALTGLSAGAALALGAANQYEKSMDQIESSTNVTTDGMKEIREIAKNLYGENYGEDWADLANAISTTKSVTKLTGKELEQATANALIYRDVFGEDVTQSIKASDTMMRNFGITSENAYNLLAQGAKNGLNKSDELIDTANEYAPSFSALGFTANQMFDTFSAGLEGGAFNLDKVGDAIKEFNIRAKDGSKTSKEAFSSLGMDANKMGQIFAKGGPEAQKSFQTIIKAISDIKDPVKQNAIAVGLFGTQAEDLEMNVLKSMGNVRSQFDMTKMTMEQIENVKYDNLSSAFQGIKRSLEMGVLIPIGEKLLPIVTNVSKKFMKYMPLIESVVKSSMDKVGSAFSFATNLFNKFMPDTGKIGGAFSKIKDVAVNTFNKLAPVLTTVIGIITPIVLDAVTFIKDIFGQILTFWNENGSQIMKAVQNVFSFIAGVVKFIAPVVMFIINSLWKNVKGVIQGGLDVILGLVKTFSSLFTGDWSGVWDGVKQILGGALRFLWNLWNLLMVGKLIGSLKALGSKLVSFLTGFGKNVGTNIQYYYHLFVDGFYKIGMGIFSVVGKAFAGIFNVIKTAVMNYIQVFQMARTFGVNVFMSIFSAVRNLFSTVFSYIRAAFSSVVSSVGSGISSFVTRIGGFMLNLWTNITTIFANIKTAMATPFSSLVSIVRSVVETAKGLVSGLFSNVLGTGKSAINGLIMGANAMINGINGLKVTIPDWVPKIGGNSLGFSIPNIPMLAKGGITTGPTLAMIGEGAEQEAVLPLSKLEGLLSSQPGASKSQNEQMPQIVYNPQIIIQGNADESIMNKALSQGYNEFRQFMQRYEAEKRRVSFNN